MHELIYINLVPAYGFDRRVKLHSNPSCLMPDGGGYGDFAAIKALGRAAWSASQVAQLLAALSFA